MTFVRALSGLAAAAMTFAGAIAVSQSAKAEDLVDFLWGGSAEYGGGRSVTSFSPQFKPGQIIVSFSDRRLYLITKPGQAITYPVAVPMGEARWQGVTFVSSKKINPSWTPTPEMVRNNPKLPRWVPGGHPMNPLGVRAMYLGSSAYRIHGTDAPWTIGQPVSHGCIRMTNDDVLDLYPRVNVGMRVTVTWQRFSTSPIASSTGYDSGSSYAGGGTYSASSSTPGAYGKPLRHSDAGSFGSLFNYGDDQDAQEAPPAPSAAADAEQPPADAPKKKSASAAKKKPVTDTAEAEKSDKPQKASVSPSTSSPVTSHAPANTDSVPDPKASGEKSTDASPHGLPLTKASASAADTLRVEKASSQIQ